VAWRVETITKYRNISSRDQISWSSVHVTKRFPYFKKPDMIVFLFFWFVTTAQFVVTFSNEPEPDVYC
jgi:hypothetical protein